MSRRISWRELPLNNLVFTAEPEVREPNDKKEGRTAEVWDISASAAPGIRAELYRLGFSRTKLFPGLDSLCQELRLTAHLPVAVMSDEVHQKALGSPAALKEDELDMQQDTA
jgi:hypothetical protein